MMRDESDAILDDLLSRWHSYCRGFQLSAQSACPMFRDSLRSKGERLLEAITEDQHWAGVFKAIDFHVGEMKDPWRAAIYILARNCYTGRQVWMSPRLPKDATERAAIVSVARAQLVQRLMNAGVM